LRYLFLQEEQEQEEEEEDDEEEEDYKISAEQCSFLTMVGETRGIPFPLSFTSLLSLVIYCPCRKDLEHAIC